MAASLVTPHPLQPDHYPPYSYQVSSNHQQTGSLRP
jgi:hypothetical protein